MIIYRKVVDKYYIPTKLGILAFHQFLKIIVVLSPFCWIKIRIRIVFAWIRIRIKVFPRSCFGSETNFFKSWILIRIKMVQIRHTGYVG